MITKHKNEKYSKCLKKHSAEKRNSAKLIKRLKLHIIWTVLQTMAGMWML